MIKFITFGKKSSQVRDYQEEREVEPVLTVEDMQGKCELLLEEVYLQGLGLDRNQEDINKDRETAIDNDRVMDIYYRDKTFQIFILRTVPELEKLSKELQEVVDGLKKDPLSLYINRKIQEEFKNRCAKAKSGYFFDKKSIADSVEKQYIKLANGLTIEDRAINYKTQNFLPPKENKKNINLKS